VTPIGAPVSGNVPAGLTPPPRGVVPGVTVLGLTPPPGGTVSVSPVGVEAVGVGVVLGLTLP
jgi:hypothetical protein